MRRERIRKALTAIFDSSGMDPCEFLLVLEDAIRKSKGIHGISNKSVEVALDMAMEGASSGALLGNTSKCKEKPLDLPKTIHESKEQKMTEEEAENIKRLLRELKIL